MPYWTAATLEEKEQNEECELQQSHSISWHGWHGLVAGKGKDRQVQQLVNVVPPMAPQEESEAFDGKVQFHICAWKWVLRDIEIKWNKRTAELVTGESFWKKHDHLQTSADRHIMLSAFTDRVGPASFPDTRLGRKWITGSVYKSKTPWMSTIILKANTVITQCYCTGYHVDLSPFCKTKKSEKLMPAS